MVLLKQKVDIKYFNKIIKLNCCKLSDFYKKLRVLLFLQSCSVSVCLSDKQLGLI